MNRRQYFQPQRYIVPGLPHFAAPSIPVYHPPYSVASMNSAPLFSQPDCCPICVRHSMMPYQQQCSPYLCYSGLSMPGSDVCRYPTPPTGINLPYTTQHLPSFGFFRPPPYSSIPFPPPPPQQMGAAQAPDRFDGSRNCFSAYNPSSHQLHVTRENDRSQSTIRYKANNTYNRAGFNPATLGTSQQHFQNGQSKSQHKNSTVTLRKGGTRRKKMENKPRHRRGTSNAGEPVEISCIVPTNDDHDTEYETLDEEVNDDTQHPNDTDWPNATTLTAEAIPLSNKCHTYDKESSQHQRSNTHRLPLDYTLITNDKSFSHVNFNPDMLPSKLDKMWIQIGTPKQRRQDELHRTETDKTIRSPNVPALKKSAIPSKHGTGLHALTDNCDMSIRHLSDNQVYYVVRPAKNNDDIFTNYIEPHKKIHLQSCKGCTHKPRCAQCCCRLCNIIGEDSDLTRSQVVSRVLEILDESTETWDHENSELNSSNNNNNNSNGTRSNNAECRRLSAFSSISNCSLDKSQSNVDTDNEITDPNNNCPQDKSKEFWWDKSTDFGLKRSNGNLPEGLNPNVELPRAFIREVDDFVVVDTAPKITMRNYDEANNNCGLMFDKQASQELEEKVENFTQEPLADRKKLDVDWNSIRTVVPKEYSSFTKKGTSEVYDINGTSLHNIVSMISDKDPSNHQTVPISDQDNAIIAFMSRVTSESSDLENQEEMNNSLLTKNNMSHQSLQGKHVEAKRVSTPCIPSRVVSNWGKQDVRLLLIATSVSSSPHATTTWCPITASTPSCESVALSTINPPTSLNTNNVVLAKPDNCSYRQAKSMPTTPIGCNMTRVAARTAKYLPSSAERRKTENLQQWNTISETPQGEMQIDCRKFNIQKESHNIVSDATFTTPVQLPINGNVLNTPLSPSPQMQLFSPQSCGHGELCKNKTANNIERQVIENDCLKFGKSKQPIRMENVKSVHSQQGSFIPRLKRLADINRLPETVQSVTVQHTAQAKNGTSNVLSSNFKEPMILDNAKSNPTSPCSSCTATPYSTPENLSGSKTVTKSKRPQRSTTQSKRSARKTIIVPKSIKTLPRHSKSSDTLHKANEHTRTIGKKGGLLIKNAKNKVQTSASAGGSTSGNVSNKIVGTFPPTRRSPRTSRLSLSTKSCVPKKNNISSKSSLSIVSCNETTLSKSKVNNTTNDSTTLSELEVPIHKETSKYVSGLISSVTTSSGSSDTSCPRETQSPSIEHSQNLIDVAHGRVHSTIKSIVQALVNQQSVYQPKAACSPSLAALRENRCHPFNTGVLQAILSNSNVRPFVRQRPSTAPSSPTLCLNKTSFQSIRRSASLSDVFYDSTIDRSASVWSQQDDCPPDAKDIAAKTNRRENVIISNIENPFIPLKATVPFGRYQKKSASTYVGYSPPTLTPTQKVASPSSTSLSMQSSVAPDEVQCKVTNISPPIVPISNTQEIPAAQYRSRVLSVELEKEIREKVELLVDSVRGVTVLGSVNNQKKSTTKSLSPPVVLEKDLSSLSGQNDSVHNKLAESLKEGGRRRSLDQSTQTQNNQIPDQDNQGFSKQKLTIPKKPPRTNSPNSNNVSSKDIPVTQHSYVGNPPIMPYYPLLTTMPRYSPHRHSHSHFLSPTFVPIGIGQSFYRGAGISGLVWPGVSHQQNQASSKDTKLQNSTDDAKQPKKESVDKSSEIAPGVVMIPATNVLSSYYLPPPYPEVPHPSGPVRKSKPVIRRRRSFPGPISSASVAKARLNRRHGYSKINAAKHFAKLSTRQQADINQSHPPPRSSIARRQRFVRSSLSDDAVFQSVEQKSRAPIFVTKPARDKNPVFNDAQPKAKDRTASKTSGETGTNLGTETALRPGSPSGAETGYSSGATSSGRASPEKHNEEQAAHSAKLDVILEEKQTVTRELVEPKQNYTIGTEKHKKGKNEGTTTTTTTVSSSGHHSNSSFHTIKRIKRFMSAKKGASKHQSECVTNSSETGNPACKEDSAKLSTVKKSKSQSKLSKKQDSNTNQGNQGNKENFREIFRKARRVATTGDVSGQSQSKGLESAVVGAPNSKSNTGWMRPPGHRQNFDLKQALLKPSFVAVAPSEIRDVKLSENGHNPTENSKARRSISALYTTIQPASKRRSVSTPGIRINSETGDVMEEGDSVLCSNDSNTGMQRVLSSTAIDADSLEELTQSKTLKGDNEQLPSDMSDTVLQNSTGVAIHGRESNQI